MPRRTLAVLVVLTAGLLAMLAGLAYGDYPIVQRLVEFICVECLGLA